MLCLLYLKKYLGDCPWIFFFFFFKESGICGSLVFTDMILIYCYFNVNKHRPGHKFHANKPNCKINRTKININVT